MIDIKQVYHDYLLSESKKNRQKYDKYKGWFSASSAGSCFIKQHLKKEGAEEKPLDDRTLRLLRLGTIVHEDISKAIEQLHNKESDVQGFVHTDYSLFWERRVEMPELNVLGHLDYAIHNYEDDLLEVYDLKTAHTFKWKKVFGRNIDPKPSVNYQLQLGTYGFGLANELEVQNVELGLVWYKKDDSSMKVQSIDDVWMDNAYEYWIELNETLANRVPNVGDDNAPVYNWECRYCPYKGTECEGL
jgi:hypothetical protein